MTFFACFDNTLFARGLSCITLVFICVHYLISGQLHWLDINFQTTKIIALSVFGNRASPYHILFRFTSRWNDINCLRFFLFQVGSGLARHNYWHLALLHLASVSGQCECQVHVSPTRQLCSFDQLIHTLRLVKIVDVFKWIFSNENVSVSARI